MRQFLTAAFVIGGLALSAAPTSAHWEDAIAAGRKAGPIKLGETTVRQAKRWFGEPNDQRVVEIGCTKAVKVKWGEDLIVFAGRSEGKIYPIAEARVGTRVLRSDKLGDFRIHTRRGLRVGDSENRVRNLYPKADGQTHKGHTHYLLGDGAQLLARVEAGEVVMLETRPYEWC